MSETINCDQLARLLSSRELFAVFDVRERGEYNQCQIPGATSLPRSQIESRIAELVPGRGVEVVLYDEGGERARMAALTLSDLGYANLSILENGLESWCGEGRETVSGVNVPSKAFGEKVYHDHAVPDVSPEELKALIQRESDLAILDVRTPEEHARFCIPGAVNVPGGDLIHLADDLRHRRAVIVHCAGRTRSIIGAAALRRLGLTKARALRNGTMGWVLAGFDLEMRPARFAPAASQTSRENALVAAQRIAIEENIRLIPVISLRVMIGEVAYLIDVRSEEEYAEGHIAGSINVPGGQAVQRADDFVAVRNAPVVFISGDAARAVMAAHWYTQMGFPNVAVLEGGLESWRRSGEALVSGRRAATPLGFEAARAAVRSIGVDALRQSLAVPSALLLDVGSSQEYESAHIPGAKWMSRGWVDIKLPEFCPNRTQRILLSCADGTQSVFAASGLAHSGYSEVFVLAGGVRAWIAAGQGTESGLTDCLTESNDVVLSPSIRGSNEDMQKYLDWELKLKH